MKPLQQQSTVQTNTETDFNFSIKASAHAFKILSDSLYSNKILAVVREYLTNALDAHRDNNKMDTPFETGISMDEEWFVRDFGKGLSEQQIKEFYCTYFSSSKTGTNEQTGMLGLGCKSAFAYTDQFTVTSWFNDEKTTYHIYLENSEPKVTIISKSPSSEPTGVRVSLEIKSQDVVEFTEYMGDVLKYFPLEIIPKAFKHNAQYFIDNSLEMEYCYITYDYRSYVLMGNVLYPLDVTLIPNVKDIYKKTKSRIFKVPVGSVSIQPSREGLSYDKPTIKFLRSFIEKAFNEFKTFIHKERVKVRLKSKNEFNIPKVPNDLIYSTYKYSETSNYGKSTHPNHKYFNYNLNCYIFKKHETKRFNRHLGDTTNLPYLNKDSIIILDTKQRSPKENSILKQWLADKDTTKVYVFKFAHKHYLKHFRKLIRKYYCNKIYDSFNQFFDVVYPNGIPKQVRTAVSKPLKTYKIIRVNDEAEFELPFKDIKAIALDDNNALFHKTPINVLKEVSKNYGYNKEAFIVDSDLYFRLTTSTTQWEDKFKIFLIDSLVKVNPKDYLKFWLLNLPYSYYSMDLLVKNKDICLEYSPCHALCEEAGLNSNLFAQAQSYIYVSSLAKILNLDIEKADLIKLIQTRLRSWFTQLGYGEAISFWINVPRTLPNIQLVTIITVLGKEQSFIKIIEDISNELIKYQRND